MSKILKEEFDKLRQDLIIAYDAKGMRASGNFAESLDVIIGDKFKSKKGKTVRTLLSVSECGKIGYFECKTKSDIIYHKWIYFKAWNEISNQLKIKLK